MKICVWSISISRQWVSGGVPGRRVHVPLHPVLLLLRHPPDPRWPGVPWGCCWCWCLVLRSSHSIFFTLILFSVLDLVKLKNQSQGLMERMETPSLVRLFFGDMTLPSLGCFLGFLVLFLVSWAGYSWSHRLLSRRPLRSHLSCYLLLFLKMIIYD